VERIERITVVGLGYVGLPLAIELSNHFPVTGYDSDFGKIERLVNCSDDTGELEKEQIEHAITVNSLKLSWDASCLRNSSFYIVCVPTPVDKNGVPDLKYVHEACSAVAWNISPGSVIVVESTVAPGTTESCAAQIANISGLTYKRDFWVGHSPERVSPGESSMSLKKMVKLISGDCASTLERIKDVYTKIIDAGVHAAPSIKVAEASKLLENAQRDVNIALMNEASQIFRKLGINTHEVLDCARTKMNFSYYSPGLVGGHCIGVDSYYLADSGLKLGIKPRVLLCARQVNENMVQVVGTAVMEFLSNSKRKESKPRIGVFGLTYKENVSDLRNSKIPDLVNFLQSFGLDTVVHDPLCSRDMVFQSHGLHLHDFEEIQCLDVLILAVPHQYYLRRGLAITRKLNHGGAVFDLKFALVPESIPESAVHWVL
jgi:UDP-N-acetyl-D-galactosamine dehydrogenase